MKYNHEHECGCGGEHHHHDHECNCGNEHHHEHECECNCDDDACDCGCEDEDTENLHQPDKYNEALSKYNTVLKDEEVAAQTAHIIEKYVKENDTVEVKKFLFHCIDLTTLKCTDSEPSVMKFTQHVNDFVDAYPELDNVAAICVYPNMAEIVNDTLEADNVKIACVSGGFPSSQTFTEVKVAETAMALHAGADEIDIVISVGKFLSGDYEGMCDEIEELKEVCGDKHLKVILETGALGSASNIKKASILSMYSGADFIKTSTGFSTGGATFHDIELFAKHVAGRCKIKAAGGISTVEDIEKFLDLGADRLGTSRAVKLLTSGEAGSGY